MSKTPKRKQGLATAKSQTLKVFNDLSVNARFPELYEKWGLMEPNQKERVLMNFTLLSTPAEWISSYEVNGKKIKYIKSHIATRILNLLFGVGNWTIEIVRMDSEDNGQAYISYGYGYLVVKWFDGTERKITTAGSGKMSKKNGMVSRGDDMKAVISDMRKKALANMGFFADIYGSVEAVEDSKANAKEELNEQKPTYSYQQLSVLVDKLIEDYMNGIEVGDRPDRAVRILKEAKFNDLLLKVKSSINGTNS